MERRKFIRDTALTASVIAFIKKNAIATLTENRGLMTISKMTFYLEQQSRLKLY
jgi:hypothetical protein